MMCEEKAYRYWLQNIPGLKAPGRKKLLQELNTAKHIYDLPGKALCRILDEEQARILQEGKQHWDVFYEYEKLLNRGIGFTAYGMADYPQRLLHIPSPPQVLYYRGKLPADEKPTVAIVGARMCSEYGRAAAKEFGSKLAESGIQIISGLAMGIDGISQRAAIDAGADSFGVLGCGVDVCYPKSNQDLYERLLKQGGVLSEFLPGTPPKAQHFPARNRIISGLSDLVLVIEAKEKSGTGITVDMALEQGREVYALPGRITDALSKGCHKLIKQGAGIATSPEDIIAALYYEETALLKGKIGAAETKVSCAEKKLTGQEQEVWRFLDTTPQGLQEIHDRRWEHREREKDNLVGTGTIQETMECLMNICLKGAAEMKNGGYMKKDNFL